MNIIHDRLPSGTSQHFLGGIQANDSRSGTKFCKNRVRGIVNLFEELQVKVLFMFHFLAQCSALSFFAT